MDEVVTSNFFTNSGLNSSLTVMTVMCERLESLLRLNPQTERSFELAWANK